MTTTDEALQIIENHRSDFGTETIPFSQTKGRILAQDITADRDFPPFNRAAMDGIALSSEDWNNGMRSFPVDGEQFAGAPRETLAPKTCMEIMTGAVVPHGADIVIRYEDVTIENGQATVNLDKASEWQNVHRQGTDAKKSAILIAKGKQLTYGDIGIMATVGQTAVDVKAFPKVAILSTGDELVEPDESPLPHQIRKSNVHTLCSLLGDKGLTYDRYHINDEKEEIAKVLGKIINDYEVVLMSGGVSKGKRDYIPEVLEDLGVKKHFHRVMQRPGKPLWFGSNDHATVFGFPGNPVSTLVCFTIYFNHWLNQSMGNPSGNHFAQLTEEIRFGKDLTYFIPVRIANHRGVVAAQPLHGHGSGDLVSLSEADGFLELDRRKDVFEKGEVYRIHLI